LVCRIGINNLAQVTGRIIIDTESFDRNNPTKSSAYNDDLHPADFKVNQKVGMDFKKMVTVIQNDYEDEGEGPKIDLTDDGRLICKSTVPGYSLKQKKWSK
jgi:hypothetical protein